MERRKDKHEYYLNIALDIAQRSTCLNKHYGSVIVNADNIIISTGYNGAPRGQLHCEQCKRSTSKPGEDYHICKSIHSESNAIIQGGLACKGSVLYINGYQPNDKSVVDCHPCFQCTKVILNAQIKSIIIPYHETFNIIDPQVLYLCYVDKINYKG